MDKSTKLLVETSQRLEEAQIYFDNGKFEHAYKAYIKTASFCLEILPSIRDPRANSLIRKNLDGIMDRAEMCKKKFESQEAQRLAGRQDRANTLSQEEDQKEKEDGAAMSTRDRVAMEIYGTERTYVKGLRQLKQVYVRPLQLAAGSSLCILPEADVQRLFNSIDSILNLNTKLMEQVGEKVKEWSGEQTLGDVFVEFSPYFKMYLAYVFTFDTVQKEVLQLRTENKRFQAFLECAEKTEGVATVPTLMITPIQRIPRYKLLIQELLKHTPEEHEDAPLLKGALAQIEEAATHINTMLGKQESAVKIMNIQSSFMGKINLMTDNTRKFVLEGVLRKFNRTNNDIVDRTFFLFSDRLVYGTQVGNDEQPRYKNHKIYDLRSLVAKELPPHDADHQFCFQVLYRNEVLKLAARNQAMRARWVSAINECSEQEKVKKSDLAVRRNKGTFGKGKLQRML